MILVVDAGAQTMVSRPPLLISPARGLCKGVSGLESGRPIPRCIPIVPPRSSVAPENIPRVLL
jgi:hypothetical protein